MRFPSAPRTVRLARGVDVQDEARDLAPIRSIPSGVEQPEVGHDVLLVVAGENGISRSGVGDGRDRSGGGCMGDPSASISRCLWQIDRMTIPLYGYLRLRSAAERRGPGRIR